MLAKDNAAISLADERPSLSPQSPPLIPEDKLHRVSIPVDPAASSSSVTRWSLQRNPLTVRREIPTFDDLIIPETSLADVNLSEMPGLQNTGKALG